MKKHFRVFLERQYYAHVKHLSIALHVSRILSTRGMLSQHALQVVSRHTLQQVSRGSGIPACLAGFQAHTQGGSLGGSGKGEGISRPIAKGEVEGGSGPGPHPRGISGGSGQGVHAPGVGVCSRGALLLGVGVWSPPGRLLLWTVRILLECILVISMVSTVV